jgi:hypothetical protein
MSLTLKAFATLARSLPGATDDEIIAVAKQAGGAVVEAAQPVVKKAAQSVQDILSGADFGILSAANPMGSVLPEADNLARHTSLLGRVRELGFEPLEQRGVYGAAPETSLLVPGLTADLTKQLGREFEQAAVISGQGWHRLADDATFPRLRLDYDQAAEDYYSELVDPVSGQSLRYQMQFPEEAYGAPPSAAPSAPSGGSDQIEALSPSPDSSTLDEISNPAPLLISLPPKLVKGLGSLAKALQKTDQPGVYVLHPQARDRVAQLLEIGQKLPKQSNWEGMPPELLEAFDGDEVAAKRWAQMWGATSPGTSAAVTNREALSANLFAIERPGELMTVEQARAMDPVITMAGSKVPNINNAIQGKRLSKPKVDRMGRFMVGEQGVIPIDVHTLYGMGAKSNVYDREVPALRAKIVKAEGLPLRGGLNAEDIYSRVENALRTTLDDLAPGAVQNATFAQFWEGVRFAKGLKHQGGPIDLLRKKGLLEKAAMLDPGRLKKVLKTAGWTAGAAAAVLRAVEAEAQQVGPRAGAEGPERPLDDPRSPRPAVKEWAQGKSRETDITLPGESSKAKTAAPMNRRVSRPSKD